MITSGKMQYLYDETGRRYLDVGFDGNRERGGVGWFFSSFLKLITSSAPARKTVDKATCALRLCASLPLNQCIKPNPTPPSLFSSQRPLAAS